MAQHGTLTQVEVTPLTKRPANPDAADLSLKVVQSIGDGSVEGTLNAIATARREGTDLVVAPTSPVPTGGVTIWLGDMSSGLLSVEMFDFEWDGRQQAAFEWSTIHPDRPFDWCTSDGWLSWRRGVVIAFADCRDGAQHDAQYADTDLSGRVGADPDTWIALTRLVVGRRMLIAAITDNISAETPAGDRFRFDEPLEMREEPADLAAILAAEANGVALFVGDLPRLEDQGRASFRFAVDGQMWEGAFELGLDTDSVRLYEFRLLGSPSVPVSFNGWVDECSYLENILATFVDTPTLSHGWMAIPRSEKHPPQTPDGGQASKLDTSRWNAALAQRIVRTYMGEGPGYVRRFG